MILWLLAAVVFLLLVRYAFYVRHRRQVRKLILDRLYGWEQRRAAWTPCEGDGIRPLRPRV